MKTARSQAVDERTHALEVGRVAPDVSRGWPILEPEHGAVVEPNAVVVSSEVVVDDGLVGADSAIAEGVKRTVFSVMLNHSPGGKHDQDDQHDQH